MRHAFQTACLGAAMLVAARVAGAAEPPADPPPVPPAAVLVVFPFASPDDAGREGAKFADALRLRGRRLGLITVDGLSTADCLASAAPPDLDTPAAQAAPLLKDRFAAALGLWGTIRRDGDAFVVDVRGLDLRRGTDALTLSKTYRATDGQALVAVQREILTDLTGRTAEPAVAEASPEEDARVPTTGPELVKNGDFESGTDAPDGWDRPDGLTTFWARGARSDRGRFLRIDTNVLESQWRTWREKVKAGARAADAPPKSPTHAPKYDTVAGTYGIAYFSDPIAVTPGQSYKVTVACHSGGDDFFFPKLFIRGYGNVAGESRVVYDAYLALRTATQGKDWETNVRLIRIPTDTRAPVTHVRLMLYAYWPPGCYEFDDVSMKEVAPTAAPSDAKD